MSKEKKFPLKTKTKPKQLECLFIRIFIAASLTRSCHM